LPARLVPERLPPLARLPGRSELVLLRVLRAWAAPASVRWARLRSRPQRQR
jgi:hypothetical protein